MAATEKPATMAPPKPQRSGVVEYDVKKCLTCRECEVACSLYHERECNPALSRIQIVYDDFIPGFPDIRVCKQCDFPACYNACVDRWGDSAIYIDEETGARITDPDKCRGCGSCYRACPLSPERAVIAYKTKDGRRRVYYRCDLCSGREEGPICVEVCPGNALTFVPAKERRR